MPFFSRQPKRSVPEPVKPPQHGAINPLRPDTSELDSFRGRILWSAVSILALGVLAYAVYGPWFSVRTVTISGTRELNPVSVQAVTERYLDLWRAGLVPNRNLWLLSRRALSDALAKKIQTRLSIEEVRIVKKNRHDLEVVIIERSPVALWTSGDSRGTIDRTGVIITTVNDLAGLPTIVDSGLKPFSVGDQVLTEPVMVGWKILNDAFVGSAIEIEQYRIPVPTCPTKIITPEVPRNINQAVEQNPPISGLNLNSGEPTTVNTNATNTNAEVNTNSQDPIVVQTDCDTAALAKASQEIHAKLKDGPLVLFDRHQNLELAVRTVKRLISDSANSGATYIDIRFQERVYIK